MTVTPPANRQRRNAWCHRARGGREAGVGEVVSVMTVAAIAVVFVLLLILAGRGAEARTRVDHAAEAAAQAAARERDPATAISRAVATVDASLTGLCHNAPLVEVDTGEYRAGGHVTVAITCPIDTADLAPLPLPGSVHLTGSSRAVIDTYRSQP